MNRRGFTIVEILVAAGLSGVVLALLWQSHRSTTASAARLEGRLSLLAGAQLLEERLRDDVARCIRPVSDSRPAIENGRLNLLVWLEHRILERAERLYDPKHLDASWLTADRVTYELDATTGHVVRTAPSGREVFRHTRFRSLRFELSPDGAAEVLKIEVQTADTPGEMTIEITLPPKLGEPGPLHWPEEYFHTRPAVRERS